MSGPADRTAEAALGDLAGDSLLMEVLKRIDNETDRVLLLAHAGLEISVRNLALKFGIDRAELAGRIATILSALQEDTDLAVKLRDFRRAGRRENYLVLARRLGLSAWFCSYCEQFMVQPERGRRRNTCGDRCRMRLHRAQEEARNSRMYHFPGARRVGAPDEVLRTLVSPIDECHEPVRHQRDQPRWWHPRTKLRDRAIILLAFGCPAPLSPDAIAALDLRHAVHTRESLYLAIGPKQYVAVPPRADQTICATAALLDWRGQMGGGVQGPLFVHLDAAGPLRLSAADVTGIISTAMARAGHPGHLRLEASTPVLSLLAEDDVRA
jgi:hypothetical protein